MGVVTLVSLLIAPAEDKPTEPAPVTEAAPLSAFTGSLTAMSPPVVVCRTMLPPLVVMPTIVPLAPVSDPTANEADVSLKAKLLPGPVTEAATVPTALALDKSTDPTELIARLPVVVLIDPPGPSLMVLGDCSLTAEVEKFVAAVVKEIRSLVAAVWVRSTVIVPDVRFPPGR